MNKKPNTPNSPPTKNSTQDTLEQEPLKDMQLRQRIKEDYPEMTEEAIDALLADWGE